MALAHAEIIAELDRLTQERGGRLRVDDVVAAARPKTAPLHSEFDWDKNRCVERDLRRQARKLIERVRYIPGRHETIVVRAPLYVRDPDAGPSEQGYTSVVDARKDPIQAGRTLEIEFDRAKSAVGRACRVAEVLGLAEDCAALLHQIEMIVVKAKALPMEGTDTDQPVA